VYRFARIALPLVALLLILPGFASGNARPYSVEPAPFRAQPRFTVTYEGSGTWRTDFHATPPNPGGDPDTNDAHDSSAQSWRLVFGDELAAEPGRTVRLDGATGRTLVVGRVDHTHVDGLYRELDRKVACAVKGAGKAPSDAGASIAARYSRASHAVSVTAYNPLVTVFTNMPQVCPDQGDSIDRILDNYFTPGFSFADLWGSDPWFTSRAVAIPARAFHRARTITIPLRGAAGGRPPLDCAVPNPAYELCSTHGSWNGALTLHRTG
jgi:hypothetical protein